MIEAVNSVVANASTLRASAEQLSASRQTQAVAVSLPETAVELPQAPYISPYISVDLNYDKAVLQIRDSDTGDVVQQFPTESRLAEIRRAKVALETRQLNTNPAPQAQAPQQSQPVAQAAPQAQQTAAPAPTQSSTGGVSVSPEIITVQEATSTPPANVSIPPQIAAAALSASAGSSVSSSSVSVLA